MISYFIIHIIYLIPDCMINKTHNTTHLLKLICLFPNTKHSKSMHIKCQVVRNT